MERSGSYEEAVVFLFRNIAWFQRLGETGPAGPGIVLVTGTEQGLPGGDIDVNPLPLVVPVLVLKRRLRAVALSDLILHFRQFFPQGLVIGLFVIVLAFILFAIFLVYQYFSIASALPSVDDIRASLEAMQKKDIPLIDKTPRIGGGQAQIAFLHPKATKALIELTQPAH